MNFDILAIQSLGGSLINLLKNCLGKLRDCSPLGCNPRKISKDSAVRCIWIYCTQILTCFST